VELDSTIAANRPVQVRVTGVTGDGGLMGSAVEPHRAIQAFSAAD